jgi:hypothetical protein
MRIRGSECAERALGGTESNRFKPCDFSTPYGSLLAHNVLENTIVHWFILKRMPDRPET